MVISATVGAGHDAATLELSGRLRAWGFDVECHDFMGLLPMRLGQRAVASHNVVMRRAPWFYGFLFGIGNRLRVTPPLTRAMLYPARRRLSRVIGSDALVVVSTYPLASQVLGLLRRRGRLSVPAITYSTDFAPHRHWVAPGMDADLAAHQVGTALARDYGAKNAAAVGAIVRRGFSPVPAEVKAAAKRRYGLPGGTLALLAAGSWGVGEIEIAAADIAATGVATPVVVCGHNYALRQRLAGRGVLALGWVDDMPGLMRAMDLLVENAGGIMALEGMAAGLPVITYRPIPGHGHENAAALQKAGLSTWVRRRRDLAAALVALAHGTRGEKQRLAARDLFRTDAAAAVARIALDHARASSTFRAPEPRAPAAADPPERGQRASRRRTLAVASVAALLAVAVLRTRRRRPPIG